MDVIAVTPLSAATDDELIAASRAVPECSDESLNELFGRYRPRVANWCARFTGDREGASDLAQEICLRAYRSLATFCGDAQFSTWIYAIARNHCLSALRRRGVQPTGIEQAGSLVDARADRVLQDLERRDAFHEVWRTVSRALTPTEARVMVLHFAEEVPLRAITRQLQLTNASGAKAYIVSARRKIAAALRTDRTGLRRQRCYIRPCDPIADSSRTHCVRGRRNRAQPALPAGAGR